MPQGRGARRCQGSFRGNPSLQCLLPSGSSCERIGVSLARYLSRMFGSCNGAENSQDRTGSTLHPRDLPRP